MRFFTVALCFLPSQVDLAVIEVHCVLSYTVDAYKAYQPKRCTALWSLFPFFHLCFILFHDSLSSTGKTCLWNAVI